MQPTASNNDRITSVDFLRGVIMIIMAIDHVRDFFHETAFTADPLSLDTPSVFFTRWITHFCAPVFLFLSGMSAWLSRNRKLTNYAEPGRSLLRRDDKTSFLIKRGLFIALFDGVVMSLILTFNPNYNVILLTTLWAIGCSMILLGLVLKISPKLILPLGLLLFFGHDAVTTWLRSGNEVGNGFLRVLFTGVYFTPITPVHVVGFLYAILPWAGVMFLGYAAGPLLNDKRKMFTIGAALLLFFIVVRFINLYGDIPWQSQTTTVKNFMAFINTSKYPPSMLFLSMTLSIACIFLALTRNTQNAFQRFASVYGRVPFFFFVMHFLLAHLLVVIVFFATGHTTAQIPNDDTLIWFRPRAFGFSLPVMYAIWFGVVLALYYPCRWFYDYKRTKDLAWLKYV
jgi:uncharacterized membrane protein